MLGDIDKKVRFYIHQVTQYGGAISRSIAVSVAKVLVERGKSLGKVKITETLGKLIVETYGVC